MAQLKHPKMVDIRDILDENTRLPALVAASAEKLSRKVNHSEVKNIAAISKAIGSRPTEAIVALPASAVSTSSTRPAANDSTIHTAPYSRKARVFFSTATRLKNKLLTGATPCQCTSAGACQKASDTGR